MTDRTTQATTETSTETSTETTTQTSTETTTQTSRWLTLPDVADRLGVDVMKVRQMLRDRELIGVREDGVVKVPSDLVHDGQVVKGLSGVLTLLADAGYADDEAVRWLLTDDSLPGRPVDALRENRGTEVKRRAQSLGF